MNPGDMDDPAMQKLHILTSKAKNGIFFYKEGPQLLQPWDDNNHFWILSKTFRC